MQKSSNFTVPAIYKLDVPNIPNTAEHFCRTYTLTNYNIEYLHFHKNIEIGVCLSGRGISYVNNIEYPFSSGDVQIVFPFQHHLSKNSSTEQSVWNWITIDYEKLFEKVGFFSIIKIQEILKNEMSICGIVDKKLYPEACNLIEKLVNTTISPEAIHKYIEEEQAALFFALVMELWRISATLPKLSLNLTNESLLAISPAIDVIKKSIENGKTPKVTELPHHCSMSLSTFRRAFIKELGLTPQEYIEILKIQKAKKMLAHTKLPITEISNIIGYGNISSFNRAFLKHVGIPPTQFRNNFR